MKHLILKYLQINDISVVNILLVISNWVYTIFNILLSMVPSGR